MSDPGNVAHTDQDMPKDTGKATPLPGGYSAPPVKRVEKQQQMAKNDCPFRPPAKLNLEGDEKCMITKSVADPSLVANLMPAGKFEPQKGPPSGTLAFMNSSTILSDNPNLIRPTPESSKATHDHKETKGSDTKLKKPRSVDVPLVGVSNEKIAPKKSPNVVEEHKQESGSKVKAKADHEQKTKKPSSADVIESSSKKKSADHATKSNKKDAHDPPKGSNSKEKAKEEVSPPAPGKKTDSKTKATHKGSETKVSHSKGHHSHSKEKVPKPTAPGDHHDKSKTKSDGKSKPKSADKKDK